MDTNFCNLLNIWDRVFELTSRNQTACLLTMALTTRPMKKNSFLDAYFGKLYFLAKDIAKAPGIKNKFLYLLDALRLESYGQS